MWAPTADWITGSSPVMTILGLKTSKIPSLPGLTRQSRANGTGGEAT